MKRKFLVLLSLMLIFTLFTACSNPVAPDPSKATEQTKNPQADTKPSDTGKNTSTSNTSNSTINVKTSTITGYSEDGSTIKGLNVYDTIDYDITQDGINDKITLYSDARKDANGKWVISEGGQQWALLAQVGAATYSFFDRRFVQNGNVSFNVFKGKDNLIHVLVTNREKDQIEVNDIVYAEKGNSFNKKLVYSSGSIQLIH
ncbi:MAG: hypothetical protein N2Z65_05790 [Clostridiales bacterium]|nr:hypothetical protein [Clostridiales bacterium]